MAIFSFWIYDRHCNCIYNREYSSSRSTTTNTQLPTHHTQASRTLSVSTPQLSSHANLNSTNNVNNPANKLSDLATSSTSSASINNSSSTNAKIQELLTNGSINMNNGDHTSKLLFGTLFSLRKISISLTSPPQQESKTMADFSTHSSLNKFNNLKSFQTLNYKAHFYETLNGLKLLVLTDPTCRDLQGDLITIYNQFYLNHVVRNQLMPVEFREGEFISNERFISSVDGFWSGMPEFIS